MTLLFEVYSWMPAVASMKKPAVLPDVPSAEIEYINSGKQGIIASVID